MRCYDGYKNVLCSSSLIDATIFLISSTIEIYRTLIFLPLQRNRLRFIRNNTSSFLVSRQCMRLPRRPTLSIHSQYGSWVLFRYRRIFRRRDFHLTTSMPKRKVEISLSVLPNPLPGPSPILLPNCRLCDVKSTIFLFHASKTRVTSYWRVSNKIPLIKHSKQ